MSWFRRHHDEFHNVAQELHDTVEPPGVDEPVAAFGDDDEPVGGDAHAPGHRHLPPPPDEPRRRSFLSRPARMNRGGDERRL